MRPAVHLRPDRLRAHAAAAVELSGSLQEQLTRRPPEEAGADLGELAELDTTVRRAARELAELGAVLATVAAAAESADRAVAHAVHRVDRS